MVTHWLRMFPRLAQIFVVLTAMNCMAVELQKPVERNAHTIQSSAFGIPRCFVQGGSSGSSCCSHSRRELGYGMRRSESGARHSQPEVEVASVVQKDVP